MTNYKWQEGLQTALLYLDDKHQIFECIDEGANYGKLSFSDFTPRYVENHVLAYLCERDYLNFTVFQSDNSNFKQYALTDRGYQVFHRGAKIWQS